MLRPLKKEKPDALVMAMKALRKIAEFDPDLDDKARGTQAEFALNYLQGTARKAIRDVEALDDV